MRTSRNAELIRPASVRKAPRLDATKITTLNTVTYWTGSTVRLLVLERRVDAKGRVWLRVLLPGRPNGHSGWILAEATIVRATAYSVRVHLNSPHVQVLRGHRVVAEYRAVAGARATPTPTGQFAIYEIQRQSDPTGFIGPIAMHLTARSKVLDNYGGGPGTIALHGRGPASLGDPLGSHRSHGCIRLNSADALRIARLVNPGTPVLITKR